MERRGEEPELETDGGDERHVAEAGREDAQVRSEDDRRPVAKFLVFGAQGDAHHRALGGPRIDGGA